MTGPGTYTVATPRSFRCVEPVVVEFGLEVIKSGFRTLLSAGVQNADLQSGYLAAGQYLDRFNYSQRGLFGTAAAIRVLAQHSTVDDTERVSKLIAYLSNRASIEISASSIAGGPGEPGHTENKLHVESLNTYKTADVVYALSFVSSLVPGRDVLIREYVEKLQLGRRRAGGWNDSLADTDGELHYLATAHAYRALVVAGANPDSRDLDLLWDGFDPSKANDFVGTFLLLVLARYSPRSQKKDLQRKAIELWSRLENRIEHPHEANVEITITNDQDYVRVPWQPYLLECLLKLAPLRFLASKRQKVVLAMVQALGSSNGYVYEDTGSGQSTRTYSIAYDFLTAVRDALVANGVARALSLSYNNVTRVLSSSLTFLVLLVGTLAYCGWTIATWLLAEDTDIAGDLGPNLLASAIGGILTAESFQLRRRR